MSFRHTLSWVDVGFRERVTVLTSHDGSTTTVDKLRILSNAALTTASDGVVTATLAAAPTEALYPDLSDAWVVSAADITGDTTQLYIPAPLLAQADVDGRNWDSGAAPWTGFQAFLAAMNHPYTSAPLTSVTAATIARDIPQATQQWFGFSTAITWARRTLQWYGTHGRSHLTHIIGDVSSLGASFDDVMAAMQALSAAVVMTYWEDEMAIYTAAPTTGLYNSVNDSCAVYFQDDAGNIVEVQIPAPNTAIFLPDGKTLNVAQVDVADFIAQAITDLSVPTSELPVTACIGGQLRKRSVY